MSSFFRLKAIAASNYFLLELRHILRVAQLLRDTPRVSQFFLASLAQQLPNLDLTAARRQQVTAMINQLLPKIEAQLVGDSSLRESYGAMLVKLAAVSPLYAYRLRGKDSLLSFVNGLVEQTAEALRQQASSLAEAVRQPYASPATTEQAQPLPPRTVHLTAGLAEIEQVMLAIADRISWRERRQLNRLLQQDERSAELLAQRIMESGATFLAETVTQQLTPG